MVPYGSNSKVHLQRRRPRFDPWVGKIPWRRKWLPNPVFLPGKFHRQRSLAGYSPWGCKELDTTERLTHTHTLTKWSKSSIRLASLLHNLSLSTVFASLWPMVFFFSPYQTTSVLFLKFSVPLTLLTFSCSLWHCLIDFTLLLNLSAN